ncbi:hypothetical protein GOBAR_DD22832 [Gossypium barbadense]|nr:hypothetical protein GOBAR_DD22832 [Gossypium barbadense]
MGLRDIGATLPPGFRFYPSDEELVCHYLYKKIANEEVLKGTLVEIDLHTCEPWQLPGGETIELFSGTPVHGGAGRQTCGAISHYLFLFLIDHLFCVCKEVAKLNANEWYFFSFRDRKYATGFRTNRATTSGYWKATGKDRTVVDPRTQQVVGMRKTLVFYRNRAPNGIKTGWIMHEFRLETPHMPPKSVPQKQRRREQHQAELPNDVGTLNSCPFFSRPHHYGLWVSSSNQLFSHQTCPSKPWPKLAKSASI